MSWAPVLRKVSEYIPAAAAVADYMLSFYRQGTIVEDDVRQVLVKNMAYVTATTMWTIKQDSFWQEQFVS